MKKLENPYKHFDKFVVRSPLFPLNFYKKLTKGNRIKGDELKWVCQDAKIQEALFLASPSLSQTLKKWINEELSDKKEIERLTYSILRYLSRMSSRCTPFGIFAGCGVGQFSDKTRLELQGVNANYRNTSLDMNYLVALSQELVKKSNIKNQLLFYPNTSIYKAGDSLRYVEYHHHYGKRFHHIVAVDHTDYIQQVLDDSKKGALLENLANTLIDEEVNFEEATSFINEMVNSQLLVSELEPSVSGDEFLSQILKVLKKIENVDETISSLDIINKTLKELDTKIGNDTKEYIQLSKSLKELNTTFEMKSLFQTNLKLNFKENMLDSNIATKIKKGITFLNRISPQPRETNIKRFKDAFYERYENREVKLSLALDNEMGIGYLQNQGYGTINPLVDDLLIPSNSDQSSTKTIPWNSVYSVLYNKLRETLSEKKYVLELSDSYFEGFKNEWNDLPDTLSVMMQIVMVHGKEKIDMSGTGGSSAANLLGRFCHEDQELLEHTGSIINKETIINKDKILAEIVHLPESRVGNILMRPILRDYEIPYLAKSTLHPENQLDLDDLVISIKHNGEILLRSKKHNKEVIPHLTNAHNYSSNSLPIYHFLSDMQLQGKRGGLGFNWGPLAGEFDFLPRVMYDDIIFSKAIWNLKKLSIEHFLKLMNNEEELLKKITMWRSEKQMPQYVILVEGDNELLINLKNITSIKMLLDSIKNQSSFVLSEFLFSEDGIVRSNEDYYTNQVVVSFYNEEKYKKNKETVSI